MRQSIRRIKAYLIVVVVRYVRSKLEMLVVFANVGVVDVEENELADRNEDAAAARDGGWMNVLQKMLNVVVEEKARRWINGNAIRSLKGKYGTIYL